MFNVDHRLLGMLPDQCKPESPLPESRYCQVFTRAFERMWRHRAGVQRSNVAPKRATTFGFRQSNEAAVWSSLQKHKGLGAFGICMSNFDSTEVPLEPAGCSAVLFRASCVSNRLQHEMRRLCSRWMLCHSVCCALKYMTADVTQRISPNQLMTEMELFKDWSGAQAQNFHSDE